MSEKVLLLSIDEYTRMREHFIREGYASQGERTMGNGVRFADFGIVKDIILTDGTFNLVIFNDYKKEESALTIFTRDNKGYEHNIKDFTFNTRSEFHTKLSMYKNNLSKENGTIQAIDWIVKGRY